MVIKLPFGRWLMRDIASRLVWWPAATCLFKAFQWQGWTEYAGLPQLTWGQAFVFVALIAACGRSEPSRFDEIEK